MSRFSLLLIAVLISIAPAIVVAAEKSDEVNFHSARDSLKMNACVRRSTQSLLEQFQRAIEGPVLLVYECTPLLNRLSGSVAERSGLLLGP